MRNALACVSMAVVIVLAGGREVRAQGAPTAEGAIGYQYLRDDNTDIDFPFGWVASVAGNATSWLALVGEVSGSYKQYTAGAAELSLKLHSFAAGPKLMVTSNAPFAPFAQLLLGVSHGSADLGVPGASLVVRGTSFMSQFGVGVDLNMSPQRALRLELDGRQLRDEGNRGRQGRFVAALVFRN
jgi:hypothetical protein